MCKAAPGNCMQFMLMLRDSKFELGDSYLKPMFMLIALQLLELPQFVCTCKQPYNPAVGPFNQLSAVAVCLFLPLHCICYGCDLHVPELPACFMCILACMAQR